MKKLALVLATTLVSTPAMAGPYVNVVYENKLNDLAYYIQGGKTINAADGVDSESNFSGKLGAKLPITDKIKLNGEVSFAQVEDADNTFGTKLGAKFSF
jgi:uncharacterized protein YhjY with autotransporter beta-barrel domain